MKKVIVRLGNGLGNQLFTYAAAYSFAKQNNANLFIDDESGFYKRYKYELHNFNISAPIADKEYKFTNVYGKIKRKLLIKISKLSKNKIFLIEKRNKNKLTEYNIDQLKVNFNKHIYVEGYFQSEKYYAQYTESLRKEFTFKNNIINQKSSFINDIKKSNSISIHLRQEKFLPDEKHQNPKLLNSKFFENNVKLIEKGVQYFDKKIENPKYFIWSNNFNNIYKIYDNKKFTFVNENLDKDPAYDLYLMSLCKHFILSPSSMHYWAAFLSENNNKICLSPPYIKNESGYFGFSNNKDIKPKWWLDI